MSAFMHTNKHISACAKGAAPLIGRSPEHLFRLWRDANARSIKVRYGDKGLGKACGKYDPNTPDASMDELAYALQSLDYQCCEYKGWRGSPAWGCLSAARQVLKERGVTGASADCRWWSL